MDMRIPHLRNRSVRGIALLALAGLLGCDTDLAREHDAPMSIDESRPVVVRAAADEPTGDTPATTSPVPIDEIAAHASADRDSGRDAAGDDTVARARLVDVAAAERPFAVTLSGTDERDWQCVREASDGSVTVTALSFGRDGRGRALEDPFSWYLADGELVIVGETTSRLHDLRVSDPTLPPASLAHFEARGGGDSWTCTLAN